MGSPRSNAQEPIVKAAGAGRKATEEGARTARPMSHEPSRAGGTPTGKPKTASESRAMMRPSTRGVLSFAALRIMAKQRECETMWS